jgi:hypothetical protein
MLHLPVTAVIIPVTIDGLALGPFNAQRQKKMKTLAHP